jgi:hypothetical protein
MPSFKKPTYSKINPNTGANEACYTFEVEYHSSDLPLRCEIEEESDWSLATLEKELVQQASWWNQILQALLDAHSTIFSKKYTVDHIKKVVKHSIRSPIPDQFPLRAFFLPTVFQVIKGYFWITWDATYEPVQIDIPDMEEEKSTNLPPLPDDKNELCEVNLDTIPMNEKPSTDSTLDRTSFTKSMDRQKVKETQLKARLAIYKAQLQLRQFFDKYGEEFEDSEEDTEEEDSEEDEEEEEIQL